MITLVEPSTVTIAEAEIFDASTQTVTNIRSRYSINDHMIGFGDHTAPIKLLYAVASFAVHQAIKGSWQTIPPERTVQDVDYKGIEDRYSDLRGAVTQLANLEEDDERFIDPEAEAGGQAIINWLDMASVPPPAIFSHGGDSLVFTWDLGNSKRYLTPLDGIARVRSYSKEEAGKTLESHNFDMKDGAQTVKLLKLVGGTKWKILRSY